MHRIFIHNLDKSLLLNKGLQALIDERSKPDGVNLVVGSHVLLDGREGRTFPVLKSLDGSHNHESGLGVGNFLTSGPLDRKIVTFVHDIPVGLSQHGD